MKETGEHTSLCGGPRIRVQALPTCTLIFHIFHILNIFIQGANSKSILFYNLALQFTIYKVTITTLSYIGLSFTLL